MPCLGVSIRCVLFFQEFPLPSLSVCHNQGTLWSVLCFCDTIKKEIIHWNEVEAYVQEKTRNTHPHCERIESKKISRALV